MKYMTPELKTALARIDAIKAKMDSTDNDVTLIGQFFEAYDALDALTSRAWKIEGPDGIELHSSRLAAAWHAFRTGNGYVFAWRNSCETLEVDLRWLKRILHACRRFLRILTVGCWLDMSATRRDWQDQARGWIPPTDNNF